MSKARNTVLILICIVLLCGSLHAQELKGKITGRVVDDQDAPLPGVTVEATSPKMVGKATAVTDMQGEYRLLALPPGVYQIVFSLSGFKGITRQGISLTAEQTLALNVSLQPGGLEEEITVIGMSPLIDVKSTSRGIALTKDVFELLPKGRNFDSLLTVIPGVVDETLLLAGMSVDGASGAENMFFIDGINTNNLRNGESGQDISFDFAEEVLVKSSGYAAEYGGSLGGVVNIITRSGGNEFHGELIGYYMGSPLQGHLRDRLDKDPATGYTTATHIDYDVYTGKDKQYTLEGGFNLGGYILKDKLWFFASVMPKYYHRTRTLDYAIQNLDLVRDITRAENYMNFSVKLTAQPMKNVRVGASYVNSFFKYKGEDLINAYNASATQAYSDYGFSYPNHTFSSFADITLGNNALLSLHGGYYMMNQGNQLVKPSVPSYQFMADQPYNYSSTDNLMFPEIPTDLQHGAAWANMGWKTTRETKKDLKDRLNVNADFTYYFNLAGEHSLKTGVQFIRQGEDIDNISTMPVVYFAWDMELDAYGTNYGRGKYGWYSVRGNDETGPYGFFCAAKSNRWALYIQDSWTIKQKLTLNFGIRTESEYIPSYSSDPAYANVKKAVNFPFSRKLSPRFGFIYDVYGDSSLKIFGSLGIFQDVMKLNMAAGAFGGDLWTSAYYSLDDYDFTKIGVNGNYPGTYYFKLNHRSPAFDTVDPSMKPFTQREISLGLEKKLAENYAFSLRLVNKNVLWAIEDCGVYVPGLGEVYYYCNPGGKFLSKKYADAIAAGLLLEGVPDMPKAKRLYWGVNLALDKRFSDNWMAGVSYTWSRLTGNYSGLANADEFGRNDPNGERPFDLWHLMRDKQLNPIDGPLPTDRPHVFKLYGSYVFDFGLTVGGVLNAMSGTPITEDWNVDSVCYFPYGRGNMGRTHFLWFTNLYAEYNLKLGGRYKIQLSLNVDNVFNTSTARRIYNRRYATNISPGDAALLSKNWDVPATAKEEVRFNKELEFYPPIEARLGIKFVF